MPRVESKSKPAGRSAPLPFDPGDAVTGRIATVVAISPIERAYSYRIPPQLSDKVLPGVRVTVPLGPKDRPTLGFCIDTSVGPWTTAAKSVISVQDERPLLSAAMLKLGHWIARYYACPLGRTLHLMVPAAAKMGAGRRGVKWVTLPVDGVPCVKSATQARSGRSQRAGTSGTDATDGDPTSVDSALNKKPRPLTARQANVVNLVRAAGGSMAMADLMRAASVGPGVITGLARAGKLNIEWRDIAATAPDITSNAAIPPFELNDDQRVAVAALTQAVETAAFGVQVLYGVTGSGKTECYIRAIQRAIELGKQAIMLVPEIALTTQIVSRLKERFPRTEFLHSSMGDAARGRMWRAVASGDIDLIVGTRSAVFAPCRALGLVIVDEEHESSYKSQSAPRYHARDVAIARGQFEGVPVILGSATPSLETWYNLSRKKHYSHLRLPHRVGGLAMPSVSLVDMRVEHRERRGVHLLSREMENRLAATLNKGEQAVLLLNRRGYASYLHCPRCDTAVVCPHCSVRMVLHKTTQQAHCHYCHARLVVPSRCAMSGCGGPVVRFGMGTQRVEEELRTKFPASRVQRVDSDSMNKPEQFHAAFDAFQRRECDILIGTQMIAKGLDFPFVSFVGVVSADTALSAGEGDFRAEEKTFQLVLQVAGRSGRGSVGGHVVVQTFAPDSEAVRHAVSGDYESFANHELEQRRMHGLPPCSRMIRIILSDPRMTKLTREADELIERLKESLARVNVRATFSEARPAPIERIRDAYRYEVILTFETSQALLAGLDAFRAEGALSTRTQGIVVDVDPVAMQ